MPIQTAAATSTATAFDADERGFEQQNDTETTTAKAL
jgi:hypothetical protein